MKLDDPTLAQCEAMALPPLIADDPNATPRMMTPEELTPVVRSGFARTVEQRRIPTGVVPRKLSDGHEAEVQAAVDEWITMERDAAKWRAAVAAGIVKEAP